MSLHEDITRRLDELEALARDSTSSPWKWLESFPTVVLLDDEDERVIAECEEPADAAAIAAWMSLMWRAVAEDREVLKRHQRVDWYEGGAGCWYCSGEEDEGHRAVDYPCPEVRSVARRLGVTP